MPPALTTDEHSQATASLKRYMREEFDLELSELKARLLLEYVLKEIGPFAYNAGVKDAETYLRRSLEDLAGTCFEAPLGYWRNKRK